MPFDLDIIACEPTPIGLIYLRRRPVLGDSGEIVTEIALDNQFLMSSGNTKSERALSSLALEMHPGTGLRVLVGGLGLGYTAYEALRSERVAHVEVVEYLAPVIDWLRKGLMPLSRELNAEARLTITEGDVYLRLSQPQSAEGGQAPQSLHDLILIDVDHSPDERLGPSNESFYTAEGLARAKQCLAPGGVLAVWSYAESSPFADALREVFREVRVESSSFENRVLSGEETNWLFLARD
jgi:spermidine synthase